VCASKRWTREAAEEGFMDMEHVNDLFDIVSQQLGAVARSDVVVGSPLTLGAWTVVPITRVSVGMGAGGGTGEGDVHHHHGHHRGRECMGPGKGTGGGGGGGGKVRPVAVLVLGRDTVQVLPIPNKAGKLDHLMDKLPEWVDRMRECCGHKEGGGGQKEC
jgi:uncharacterized spore protein YtfJ